MKGLVAFDPAVAWRDADVFVCLGRESFERRQTTERTGARMDRLDNVSFERDDSLDDQVPRVGRMPGEGVSPDLVGARNGRTRR